MFVYIILVGYVLFLIWLIKKRRKQDEWDPFKGTEMITRLKCLKHGKVIERPFKRFEYAGQEVVLPCGSKAVIVGTYTKERELTRKEKKYKELLEKWK